jgi:protein transport protein SEC13
MAQTIATFDTAHSGTIHDAQLDYYGKRLATCSADASIRIWDVSTEQHNILAEIREHTAPVWQVSWSHPKFGSLLASASYDKQVIIWRETRQGGEWQALYRDGSHSGSVNALAWSPWELGLNLATASSDGNIGVVSNKGGDKWVRRQITNAHEFGVNAVSWAPATSPTTLASSGTAVASIGAQRLVSGGCDNLVKIWKLNEQDGEWTEQFRFPDDAHTDWVRDVSWRPNIGIPSNTIATCSEDKTIAIWSQEMEGQPWKLQARLTLPAPVWRVSWSVTGSILAAACGDNTVQLYKETTDNEWVPVTAFNERGVAKPQQESPSSI